jgi:glutaminyl-tRNA synthetase
VKDPSSGEVTEVHCTYDPDSRGGWTEDGRKVKGTSHWVSAEHSIEARIHNYSHLFSTENPGSRTGNFLDDIDPDSLEIVDNARLEPSLKDAEPGQVYQFLRKGYYCVDYKYSTGDQLVFNRTVSMKDSWAKIQKKSSS